LLDQSHQSKNEENSKGDPLKHQDGNDRILFLVRSGSVFQVISIDSVCNGKSQRDGGLTEEKSEFSLEFENFQVSKSSNHPEGISSDEHKCGPIPRVELE